MQVHAKRHPYFITLAYRNYDPVLGRMNGVDPMASKYASLTPYNYSFNDPVTFNDPNGADPYDHYNGGNQFYFSGGYYTYDDVARNPDNMGEFHSAFGWRDSYSMGFMASAMGYGRLSSWQSSTFAGVSLPYNAQMRQHARAVRNDEMSVEEYGARYGSSMGGGLGGLTNAMVYLGAVQYDGGTFTYKFGNKTYGGTYHTENGVVTSTATARVIQLDGGWVKVGAMKVSEFAPRRKAQFGGSSVVHDEHILGELPWRDVATAKLTIWGIAFEIAEHNSKPLYQGPESWAAEARMAGKVGRALGAAGVVITAYSIYQEGFTTSNTLDGIFGVVSFFGLPGAIIGGVYFGANFITMGVTGKSIGENIDEHYYVIPTVGVGFTPSIMMVPKNKN